jgi:hypothetical protein
MFKGVKEIFFVLITAAVFYFVAAKLILNMQEGLLVSGSVSNSASSSTSAPSIDNSNTSILVQDKYTDVNAAFSDSKLLQVVYDEIDKIVNDLQPYVNNTVKLKDLLTVGSIKYVPPTDDTPVVTIDGKYVLDHKTGNYTGKQVLNLVLSKGSVGADGPKGPTGPKGPQGPQGPQGPIGNLGCERMIGSYP